MAREPSGTRRVGFRATIDKSWNIASKPPPKRRRPRPTKKAQEAATDTALVDLVDWIAQHPTVTDQINAIANTLDKQVVAELDRSFDDAHRDDRRRALADHFWCDLLAALSQVLDEFQKQLDKIPDRVTSAVLAARRTHGERTPIADLTVKIAVQHAWKLIQKIPFVAAALPSVEEPLRAIRILAVMICPAPEDHREVAKYCLHPLTGECVNNLTKQRLKEALPDDWLS
jgi:hypothetical protein